MYALITPDTHVSAPLVGWQNATAVMHISPEIGARFTQYTAELGPNAHSGSPGEGIERFVFVLDGEILVSGARKTNCLERVNSLLFRRIPLTTSARRAIVVRVWRFLKSDINLLVKFRPR